MIVPLIQGGLGNQLFQYAAAISLAGKIKTDVVCDTYWYTLPVETKRKYLIDQIFTHQKSLSSYRSALLHTSNLSFLQRLSKKIHFGRLNYFHENGLAYDIRFEHMKGNVFLEGNFQSFKYHECLPPAFLESIKDPKTVSEQHNMLSAILESNSVSLHVRRGDYASNTKTNEIHGLLEQAYYIEAIKRMEEAIVDPVFFVFTDDNEYAQTLFKGDKFVHISMQKKMTEQQELILMMHCKNHIVANSSFSWWGAYANKTQEKKRIVCPRSWFKNAPAGFIYNDLIPPDWESI